MNFYDDIDQYGGRVALVSENGREITYQEMISEADRLMAPLPPRSLAFLLCHNCPESITAYIGLLRRRVAFVLINDKLDQDLFARLRETYRPQFLFGPEGIVQGKELGRLGGHQLIELEDGIASPLNPELAVMITTSGSTGSPKLVMQTYENITDNVNAFAKALRVENVVDRAITTMPMSYTYALVNINLQLLRGSCMVMTEKSLMDKEFWSLMKQQRVNTFSGVPYIFDMLKKLRFEDMGLPDFRYCTMGGGKMPHAEVREIALTCRRKGIRFIYGYGATESTCVMSLLPEEYSIEKAGSIGIALPGEELSLIDDDGSVITAPDTVGELIFRGKSVTLGYAESRFDLAQEDQWHGMLHTGDMAMRDKDGFYYIVGRLKRFLKVFGNRVNLDEIEEILRERGYTCACGGKDDLLTIYLVQASETEMRQAVEYISAKTKLHNSAFRTISIPELPRNEAGKIMYSDLERLYN